MPKIPLVAPSSSTIIPKNGLFFHPSVSSRHSEKKRVEINRIDLNLNCEISSMINLIPLYYRAPAHTHPKLSLFSSFFFYFPSITSFIRSGHTQSVQLVRLPDRFVPLSLLFLPLPLLFRIRMKSIVYPAALNCRKKEKKEIPHIDIRIPAGFNRRCPSRACASINFCKPTLSRVKKRDADYP